MMNKIIFIGLVSVLCIRANAQEKEWIDYPVRKISVNCRKCFPLTYELSKCCFIQTRDEFNELCDGGNSEINFFKEIVLGVSVRTTHYRHVFPKIPIFRYSVMREPKTNIIHVMVYHDANKGPSIDRDFVLQSWVAIPKPIGNYEIHIHFFNRNDPEIKKVFKNTY